MIQGNLFIGWSKTDITPPKKTLLQGQFHTRLSRGTISPLTATALAVEARAADGAHEQAVWLSCDLTSESFKAELLAKLENRSPGLDPRKLTINSTHTHNAPPVHSGMYEEPKDDPDFMPPDAYRDFLTTRLAEAVTAAWNGRAPGSIRRGFGYAVVGRCRRAVYADGTGRMYGQTDQPGFQGLEACDDHAVNFLFTQDAAGALTGMIVNLACPSQCDEHAYEFSSDFWHDVRLGLAARFGAGVQLLPQCAPAGDASPHLMLDQKEEKDLRDRLHVNDKGIIARRILAATEEALATASPPETKAVMAHDVMTLQLPRVKVTREQYEMEKRIPQLSEEERKRQPWGFERLWPFGLVCDLVKRYEQQDAHPLHPTEVHVIRLGDVAFATNPFELFMDYGARMRARSRALQTFLVQLADGSGDGFYLPTARALAHGHYSALIKSNWVGPEGGQQLVDETVRAINERFADRQYPRTR
jgi:hypothetical protein